MSNKEDNKVVVKVTYHPMELVVFAIILCMGIAEVCWMLGKL